MTLLTIGSISKIFTLHFKNKKFTISAVKKLVSFVLPFVKQVVYNTRNEISVDALKKSVRKTTSEDVFQNIEKSRGGIFNVDVTLSLINSLDGVNVEHGPEVDYMNQMIEYLLTDILALASEKVDSINGEAIESVVRADTEYCQMFIK